MNTSRPALLPCPFCGGTEITLDPTRHWTGMRSIIIAVDVRHWCPHNGGVRGSSITMRGKTEDEAVANWNRRAGNSSGNP